MPEEEPKKEPVSMNPDDWDLRITIELGPFKAQARIKDWRPASMFGQIEGAIANTAVVAWRKVQLIRRAREAANNEPDEPKPPTGTDECNSPS